MLNKAGNILRPLTPQEMANLYHVSRKTLNNWLRPHDHLIGPRNARYFTVLQVRKIYECLGSPISLYTE